MTWTLDSAVVLCTLIEKIAPQFGCHVALTGGTLYKSGKRKDVDIMFYRIRQTPEIDREGLFVAMEALGIKRKGHQSAWICKALFEGRKIDFFFPETGGNDTTYGATNDDLTSLI
jgi:hypothetical protein